MLVMAWQTVQVMPALAMGSVERSYSGSSNRGSSNSPLKKGTGSWQPAQNREPWTLPSRLNIARRVSSTVAS